MLLLYLALPCHLMFLLSFEELAFGQLFFNGQGTLCLCSCLGLLLSSHASIVISCFLSDLMLPLSFKELAFGQLFF